MSEALACDFCRGVFHRGSVLNTADPDVWCQYGPGPILPDGFNARIGVVGLSDQYQMRIPIESPRFPDSLKHICQLCRKRVGEEILRGLLESVTAYVIGRLGRPDETGAAIASAMNADDR